MELALFATFYKDMAFSFVNNSSLDCTLLSFSFLIDSYSYHNTKIPKKRLFHLTATNHHNPLSLTIFYLYCSLCFVNERTGSIPKKCFIQ